MPTITSSPYASNTAEPLHSLDSPSTSSKTSGLTQAEQSSCFKSGLSAVKSLLDGDEVCQRLTDFFATNTVHLQLQTCLQNPVDMIDPAGLRTMIEQKGLGPDKVGTVELPRNTRLEVIKDWQTAFPNANIYPNSSNAFGTRADNYSRTRSSEDTSASDSSSSGRLSSSSDWSDDESVGLATSSVAAATISKAQEFNYTSFPDVFKGYQKIGVHETNSDNIPSLVTNGPDVKKIGFGRGSGKGPGFYVTPGRYWKPHTTSHLSWGDGKVAVYMKADSVARCKHPAAAETLIVPNDFHLIRLAGTPEDVHRFPSVQPGNSHQAAHSDSDSDDGGILFAEAPETLGHQPHMRRR